MGHSINSGPFQGRHAAYEEVDLSISAATLTTTAGTKTSTPIEIGGPRACNASIDSTGVTAGDGLTVTIEGSEGGTFTAPDLETLATFTAISGDTAGGVTAETQPFVAMKHIRSKYVTTGTTITANCTCKVKVGF
jgi:hypothetical protein